MFCQLDTLRRCLPARIRSALDELPRTLDATYERTLQDIDDEKWEYAHRLFQCIAVASRPLRAEELAEFLAIDFDVGGIPSLVADWRPVDPGNAVLFTCSSLITFVTVDGSSVVQFSHFSVQEFLMSSRLARTSVSRYCISLAPSHTIVAQACLSVLLKLDNHINKRDIKNYPLAHYAAHHWVDHAMYQDVLSHVEYTVKCLSDRDRPHFAAWVWIYDMDQDSPSQPNAPPIYYATLWDFPRLAEWLVTARSQDVNEQGGYYGTPLCAAAARGRLRAAQVLVKCGASVDAAGSNGWSPLLWASDGKSLELSQLMLDLGADINFCDLSNRTPLSLASKNGCLEIARLLIRRGADVNLLERREWKRLSGALLWRDLASAQLPLTHSAHVNVQNELGLSLGSEHGNMSVRPRLPKQSASYFPAQNTQEPTFPESDRRIIGAFLGPQYLPFVSIWSPCVIDVAKHIHVPDVEEEDAQGTSMGPTTKRRALLVGISYHRNDRWWQLDGSHKDVDHFWNLLVCEYVFFSNEVVAKFHLQTLVSFRRYLWVRSQ